MSFVQLSVKIMYTVFHFRPVIRGLIVLLWIFVDVGFLKRLDISFFIRVSTHKQALVPQPDNGDDITYQIFKTEVEQ